MESVARGRSACGRTMVKQQHERAIEEPTSWPHPENGHQAIIVIITLARSLSLSRGHTAAVLIGRCVGGRTSTMNGKELWRKKGRAIDCSLRRLLSTDDSHSRHQDRSRCLFHCCSSTFACLPSLDAWPAAAALAIPRHATDAERALPDGAGCA